MRKLKERIFCEKLIIIGCIILIGVYTGCIIGLFILPSPKIYFSDFWSSAIMIMLVVIILSLTIENHNTHLRLLRETKEKEEKEIREIVKIFAEEIDKMLDEKFEMYQNLWEEEDLVSLKAKLNDQVSEYMFQEYLQEDSERTLIHIAVYCLFILTRLNRLNK